MTYGKRLEAAMAHAKKTRRQLADLLGCTPQTLGVVITWTGEIERKLSTAYHEQAAQILRINPHWLATGEGEMLAKHAPIQQAEPVQPYPPEIMAVAKWLNDIDDTAARDRAVRACGTLALNAAAKLEKDREREKEEKAAQILPKQSTQDNVKINIKQGN